jgi:histidine triad (HIT) family protein
MQECIFCKIVDGEIPSYKVAENDKFLAFLDISQMTQGHTLVIPKEHHQFIWDVPNAGEYFEFVQKVGNHFRNIGYKYVDTVTMGRQIPHSHVHLVPHNGDNEEWNNALKNIFDLQLDEDRRPTDEEMKITQQKFQMD